MNSIIEISRSLNEIVWGTPTIILILGTGIFLSFRLRFFQITKLKLWLVETVKGMFRRKASDGKAISQFQALSTVLAASLGTGNIAGVATALAAGGPGAIFWMWVSAVFGMITAFTENVLGIYYRRKNNSGEWVGGAMYYLRDGLSEKKLPKRLASALASLFAVFCLLASFGIGNMTQANSISSAMLSEFGIPKPLTGVILSVTAAFILIGGIKRIGKVTEKLVPFMAIMYIAACMIILALNLQRIPDIFGGIFSSAFSLSSAAGGTSGYLVSRVISTGFRRGVFSNEAGLGSSVAINISSDVKEPVGQGMWSMFAVFFDTLIMCSLTAFAVLSVPTKAVSLPEALNSISETPQYFSLNESGSLISCEPNRMIILSDVNEADETYIELPAKSIYGDRFTVKVLVDSDEITYVNLMEIRGIAGKNSDGSQLLGENGQPIITAVEINEVSGASLVAYAFGQCFGEAAGKGLAVAVLLFAFSTIIGWFCGGIQALSFLFGERFRSIYRTVYICFIAVGSCIGLSLAWEISDTLNGLMAFPNLIAVLSLSGTAAAITRNYLSRLSGKNDKPILSYSDNQ